MTWWMGNNLNRMVAAACPLLYVKPKLPKPDGRRGWRMCAAGLDPRRPHVLYSPLTGGKPHAEWRPGPLFATCAKGSNHLPPVSDCSCGVTLADTPTAVYEFWQHFAVDLHRHFRDRWGLRVADTVAPPERIANLVLVEVALIGETMPSPADGPGWSRSAGAQMVRITTPRDLTIAPRVAEYYGVPLVVEDVATAEFIRKMGFRHRARPSRRGCFSCRVVHRSTGPADYPMCERCTEHFPRTFCGIYGMSVS